MNNSVPCPVCKGTGRISADEKLVEVPKIYSCEDWEDVDGFPGHDFDCYGPARKERSYMNLGLKRQFYVCAKVGRWLLERGVGEEEIG